ncbi:MFS transporter [Lasiodiplodia theobromae]|uniref:MFS transporter n=1 Tax=Lasiodiplodia theobromae TaxID=45133 RepID=UPI0015C36029|nr:MFS transporter [Lasiodiplodia theobromae]KAF4540331.1 MFS transporter [Lasiodiplodia theobromae]
MLTRNIVLVLSQHWLQALHTSTYNTLLILLLSSPVVTRPSTSSSPSPLLFTGGLGLTPHAVGLATASIGIIGLPIQILLYPPLSARLGTLRSYRLFLWPSILIYATLPFLTLIAAQSSSSPSSGSSALLWVALITALGMQVLARAFVGPATVVLVNNCTPHPQLLATVHGLAQSISSAARMVGPLLGGAALGWAEEKGCAGAPFWGIAGLAVVNWGVLWWVVEED